MADFDNTNKGVIFKNDQKGNDKSPSYRGKGNFKGVDFELACWVKQDKNGNSYFTVAFSEPYKKDEGSSHQRAGNNLPNDDDEQSNLPF